MKGVFFMNEIILMGLAALANIVGGRSLSNPQLDIDDLNSDMRESTGSDVIDCDGSCLNGFALETLYSVGGSPRYVHLFNDDASFIYDKESCNLIEETTVNPYGDFENDILKVYVPTTRSPVRYLVFDGTNFLNADRELLSPLDRYEMICASDSEVYEAQTIDFGSFPTESSKIDNYRYFLGLRNNHALNLKGTCGIVALELVLGYYDTFYNDTIVDEKFEVDSEKFSSCAHIYDRFLSPGRFEDGLEIESAICTQGVDYHYELSSGRYVNNISAFHDNLVSICKKKVGMNPETGKGMTHNNLKSLLNAYSASKSLPFSIRACDGNLADFANFNNKSVIKHAINHNRPAIVGSYHHFVVIFAYDDTYVYLHNGWGECAKVKWSVMKGKDLFNVGTCIDAIFNGNHVHSDHYYNASTNERWCACGTRFLKTNINSMDYCPTNPSGTQAEKIHVYSENNIEVAANFLWSGAYPNCFELRPDESRIGNSSIEFNLSRPIRRIRFFARCVENNPGDIMEYSALPKLFIKKANKAFELCDSIFTNEIIDNSETGLHEIALDWVEETVDGFKIEFDFPTLGASHACKLVLKDLEVQYAE